MNIDNKDIIQFSSQTKSAGWIIITVIMSLSYRLITFFNCSGDGIKYRCRLNRTMISIKLPIRRKKMEKNATVRFMTCEVQTDVESVTYLSNLHKSKKKKKNQTHDIPLSLIATNSLLP